MRKFQKHLLSLVWKSYLQRRRRWRFLLMEFIFALLLFIIAVIIAKPVMLTPLDKNAIPPLHFDNLLDTLKDKTYLGYAPDLPRYEKIMKRASEILGVAIDKALTEDILNDKLYNRSKYAPVDYPVVWVIWKPEPFRPWRFSIRSSERARLVTGSERDSLYLRSGFIAVQLAVSQAIIESANQEEGATPLADLSLKSIPLSPLMQEDEVRKAISWILIFFTIALIPPVMETQALVVNETAMRFKRALKLFDVGYQSMYFGWLAYAFLTITPVWLLAGIVLIYIFRWIDWPMALAFIMSYMSVMIMLALVMAMFHFTAKRACAWSILFGILQLFLAELVVYHRYDAKHIGLSFFLQLVLPPLGLVHGFNHFATLETGHSANHFSLKWTIGAWLLMTVFYFVMLMLLQRTIGHQRAIGGQVSWKSIIFKQAEDKNNLRPIPTPTGNERDNLQEVDDLMAKAISFNQVSKSIMGFPVLTKLTMDIYRGEYTMLHTERIQENMMNTLEDLITGLTEPDEGTINVLGVTLDGTGNLMTTPYMMGYCQHSSTLIEDLTVKEHLILFTDISLWRETTQFSLEYRSLRLPQLLAECGLTDVRHQRVRNLDMYYRAQLCWALTLVMEPRIIFLPHYADEADFITVIRSKIKQYQGYLTIINTNFSSMKLEFADRVFVLDHGRLVFGGSPAYMFFKYGRDYRVRIAFHKSVCLQNKALAKLLEVIEKAGARVRAFYGSMMILRLPEEPTNNVAALMRHLHDNKFIYGIIDSHISLADYEEVFTRAITDIRSTNENELVNDPVARQALKVIFESPEIEIKPTLFMKWNQLKAIGWKYMAFHAHYIASMGFFMVVCVVTGTVIGQQISVLLQELEEELKLRAAQGAPLSVEALDKKTTILVRPDASDEARDVATAYTMSLQEESNTHITYTAFNKSETLHQYLMVCATYSPQQYVFKFAYGMDISKEEDGFVVQVLYSPLHADRAAAARSLSRVYTALLRFYSKKLSDIIYVYDEPLGLDMAMWMEEAMKPPLLVQFLLIVMLLYVIRLPSDEYGFFRHVQICAKDFSPFRYWTSLFFYDYVVYVLLVFLVCVTMVCFMLLNIPKYFSIDDIIIVPIVLVVYGLACIPQAYLFSLGQKNVGLNSMLFVIMNVVFGETTVIAKMASGQVLKTMLWFMALSPQFNVAYALVKIKRIFLYNNECCFVKANDMCNLFKGLHKCCDKCGVLQDCFVRKSYFTFDVGVLSEVLSIVLTAIVFMCALMLWEYRVAHSRILSWVRRVVPRLRRRRVYTVRSPGVASEFERVMLTTRERQRARESRTSTLNQGSKVLLVRSLTKVEHGVPVFRNVSLALKRGEVVGLCGLKRHGRVTLCEVLTGFVMPTEGDSIVMGKWNIWKSPHQYSMNVAFCHGRDALSPRMTVLDLLTLIATLRGIPASAVPREVMNYIQALELSSREHTVLLRLAPAEHARLHFIAAVIGAPAVIVLDECTQYQTTSVKRTMLNLLLLLRERGHGIVISSSTIETLIPVCDRLMIIGNGRVFDSGTAEELLKRYSREGMTVVVHLKDEISAIDVFTKYFKKFYINDTSEELVNVQILDEDLDWASIFERMEVLKRETPQVYSYVATTTPMDYIYNKIISAESNATYIERNRSCWYYLLHSRHEIVKPSPAILQQLQNLEHRYDLFQIRELPWSVVFQR